MIRICAVIILSLITASCDDRFETKPTDIVLTTPSVLFGSTIWIATFNGNSLAKVKDCREIAELLRERYSRSYECEVAETVIEAIKREESEMEKWGK